MFSFLYIDGSIKDEFKQLGKKMITIYSAEKIITMNPARPFASHLAVKEGKILGTGDLAELEKWGHHNGLFRHTTNLPRAEYIHRDTINDIRTGI